MDAHPTRHPTDQTLHSYALGKLDVRLAEAVHRHLEECPDCRLRVAQMSADSFLGGIRDAQARPDSRAPVISSTADLSMLAVGPGAQAPPPASTMPPGLADHADYQILRELGRGGMGVVYLAQNTLMGRKEVLKVVGSHLITRPGVADRFLREIRSAAQLHHTNIVTAYSALRLEESLVLAMEYVEGLDLAKIVKAKGPLPVANACSYVHQAVLGLQHAHERGMVHRDVKPSNLMLARAGTKAVVKVLDFGLAKVTSEGQSEGGLTREGQMLGTPDYIAPEQIRDAQSADIRADIYSLGCTLYYLLAGRPPFGGENIWDIYQAHFSMEAGPLNLVRPEVPVELAALVAKMMAKELHRRFQAPKEVAEALKPFFKSGTMAPWGTKPEVSQAGRTDTEPSESIRGSVPAQQETNAAPAPLPSGKRFTETTHPEPARDSLIDLRQEGQPFDTMLDKIPPAPSHQVHRAWAAAVATLDGLGPRNWWAAAAMLLLGLIVAWAVVLRVKTSNGMIELVGLPKDANVFVDGEEVAVTWPVGGKPAVVTVTAGKHGVRAKKDGLETSGEEVTVRAGGKERFTVRFVPLATSSEVEGKADDRPARPEVEKAPVPPAGAGNAMTSPPPSPNLAADPAVHAMGVDADKPGKVEAEKPTGKGAAQIEDFVQLFNGSDLEGWNTHPKQPGNWRVENGVLIGSGPQASFLYSERGDYKDFHLRVEARINDGGNSGVCFRTPFGQAPTAYEAQINSTHLPRQQRALRLMQPTAYEAQINSTHRDPNKTGSIYRVPGGCVAKVGQSPVPPGQWFWLEVTAEGRHIVVKVNGNTTADYRDENPFLTGGRIALQQQNPKTFVEFRKIEIKESNGTAGATGGLPRGPAETVADEPPAPAAAPSAKGAPATDSPKVTVNSIGMKLVLIPAGAFLMGSPDGDDQAEEDEKPRHRVRITRRFYLGATEVTRGQFRRFVDEASYQTNTGWQNPGFEQTDEHPVVNVSWKDAVAFCEWLSRKEGVTYRLPTEAEWEFACRAGTTTRFSTGDDPKGLAAVGNIGRGGTVAVGRYKANAWGLFDMHGNVSEWCSDAYAADYYERSPVDDPPGPDGAARRVFRGGGLRYGPRYARSANRSWRGPEDGYYRLGFRLARVQSVR
jgi:formylglycine-generating enzyme required for sulfatase activity/serine/threonine protein kinase